MFDFIGMWEQAKDELEGMWASLDTTKSAAQASDAIKRFAGTPENATMVAAIEKSRKGAEPVVLAPAPAPTPVAPEPVPTQELDLFEDTTTDNSIVPTEEAPALAPQGETPEPVVEVESNTSIINKVEAVFPSNGILSEIAQAESLTGEDPNTYREGYYGGMMQVDEVGFEDTQDVGSHPKLKKQFAKIKKEFGKDWPSMTWQDMTDPLNSAIAARLKLLNVDDPIPTTKAGRAAYWKKYYNTVAGKGTVEHFKDSNK